MKILFNKEFVGIQVVRNNRIYRAGMFWRPFAPFKIDPEIGRPTSVSQWLSFVWSRFVFFSNRDGFVGEVYTIEKHYRVLAFGFGYREYDI